MHRAQFLGHKRCVTCINCRIRIRWLDWFLNVIRLLSHCKSLLNFRPPIIDLRLCNNCVASGGWLQLIGSRSLSISRNSGETFKRAGLTPGSAQTMS
ncbi:Uncharacterized protein HZ326_15045 [Fusarium oxysporum f. sp. albedinis]|nr:Uncharacterized protein HZ326_15045 [Fusarium oxysporum f. sp. albedinis]